MLLSKKPVWLCPMQQELVGIRSQKKLQNYLSLKKDMDLLKYSSLCRLIVWKGLRGGTFVPPSHSSHPKSPVSGTSDLIQLGLG